MMIIRVLIFSKVNLSLIHRKHTVEEYKVDTVHIPGQFAMLCGGHGLKPDQGYQGDH